MRRGKVRDIVRTLPLRIFGYIVGLYSSLYFLSQEHEEKVKGNAGYESSNGVYHIVSLDVHRGETQKHVEGNQ